MSFSYSNKADDIEFKCNLVCQRCDAVKKDGTPCSRNTCKYLPYCHTHMKALCGLIVKKSSIKNAGDGLYAVRSFSAGDVISVYYGEKLTPLQNDERYGGENAVGPYGVTADKAIDDKLRIIDGPCYRSAAVYANDITNSTNAADHVYENYNAALEDRYINVDRGIQVPAFPKLHGSYMCVVAIRDIPVGEEPVEIFVDYGANYWEGASYIESSTKKYKIKNPNQLLDTRSPFLNLYENTSPARTPPPPSKRKRKATRRRR